MHKVNLITVSNLTVVFLYVVQWVQKLKLSQNQISLPVSSSNNRQKYQTNGKISHFFIIFRHLLFFWQIYKNREKDKTTAEIIRPKGRCIVMYKVVINLFWKLQRCQSMLVFENYHNKKARSLSINKQHLVSNCAGFQKLLNNEDYYSFKL